MYTSRRIIGVCFLSMVLLFPSLDEGAEYLLHKVPLDGGASTVRGDDWIVREIVVEKGATLWDYARTYLGKGYYYPHLLAYNDISNPNRIYEGKTLLVPTERVRNYAGRETLEGRTWSVSFSGLALESLTKRPERKSAVRITPPKGAVKKEIPRGIGTASEQREFDRAKALFDAGNYTKAARLFDEFVAAHPHSKLKVEALFYSAESNLKSSEAR